MWPHRIFISQSALEEWYLLHLSVLAIGVQKPNECLHNVLMICTDSFTQSAFSWHSVNSWDLGLKSTVASLLKYHFIAYLQFYLGNVFWQHIASFSTNIEWRRYECKRRDKVHKALFYWDSWCLIWQSHCVYKEQCVRHVPRTLCFSPQWRGIHI